MRARNTIFDSRSEESAWEHLRTTWSERLVFHPNLPLSRLVEAARSDFSPEGWRFYLQTNVDWTICELGSNRPIASIEFDGLGRGYSKGDVYIPERVSRDRRRKSKMDFKIRLTRRVGYPLLVIGVPEMQGLDHDARLTILDGVVGEFAERAVFDRLLDGLRERAATEVMGDAEVENEFIAAEVTAELEANLLALRAAEYESECWTRGLITSKKCEALYRPGLPDGDLVQDPDVLRRRIEAMDRASGIGCQVTVTRPNAPSVSRTVWLRNFRTVGLIPEPIARHAAEYLVLRSVLTP